MKKALLLLIIAIVYSSCIPKKDLTYFQGDPSLKDTIYQLQNKPYRLQINDILMIDIKSSDPELVEVFNATQSNNRNNTSVINEEIIYFRGYSVDLHGNIRLPYIGDMNVLGYSISEVREKIEKELANYFKNNQDIFVNVKLAGVRFTILGEVKKPGPHTIYRDQVNIVEAIAAAGDIPMEGNRKNVTIIRKNIDKTEKFSIDLTNIDAIESEHFYIQPNDIVYVEPLKQKSWGTGVTGLQSISTIVTVLSLITTTMLLIQNIK